MNVFSTATDPDDNQGPVASCIVSPARREEMAGIRQERSREDYPARQPAARIGGGRGGARGVQSLSP